MPELTSIHPFSHQFYVNVQKKKKKRIISYFCFAQDISSVGMI